MVNGPKPATNQGPARPTAPATDILPTLFGAGYGTYEVRPSNFYVSFLLHTVGLVLLLFLTHQAISHRAELQKTFNDVVDISAYIPMQAAKTTVGGGGGGGDRDKLMASKGTPPKASLNQITPPTAVIRNDHPALAVEQTIVVPPQIKLPTSPVIGDLKSVLSVPSNGVGFGSGIGNSQGGGIGSGKGGGLGPGEGGGLGGGLFRVGGGVSPPRIIYQIDPEFSEEARKAKYQGTVIVATEIGPDGRVHNARIARSLGLGLDEKAIEAVRQWKFEPAKKDGQPVAVLVNVEVNFRLY
jgi:periplasmic protein TonB